MKVRGAFTEIFRTENVTKVTPIVADLVQGHINKIKAECGLVEGNTESNRGVANRDIKPVEFSWSY